MVVTPLHIKPNIALINCIEEQCWVFNQRKIIQELIYESRIKKSEY